MEEPYLFSTQECLRQLNSKVNNMMRSFILLALVPQVSFAWSPSQVSSLVDNRQRGISSTSLAAGINDDTTLSSRRNFITQASLSAAAVLVSKSQPSYAADDELIDVYFGCGCFWHVQQ